MRLSTRKTVILFLLCITGFACAETLSLTLDEALSLARANNSDLQKEKIALDLAQLKASKTWNAFFPAVSLSLSLRDTQNLPGSVTRGLPVTDISASAGANLSLNAGVGEVMKQTLVARDSASVAYQKVEATLIRSLKKSYYSLKMDQVTISLSVKNLELAEKQASLVQRNYQNGLASELEYLLAQYNAAALKPELLQKEKKYVNSLKSFCVLLGLPLDTEIELSESVEIAFTAIKKPENFADLIEGRFDVSAALLNLEKAKSQQTGGTLTRYAPSISMSESTSMTGLQEAFTMPKSATFNFSVNIPLNGYIPFSKENVAGLENKAAVASAAIALDQTRIAAQMEIDSLFDTLEQLGESIAINRLNQKIASRAFELSEQGYNAGLVTQTDLDNARQKTLAAQLNVLSAENSYKGGLIDLAFALHIEESALSGTGEKK